MKKIASTLLLSAAISAPAFAANEGGYVAVDVGQVSFSNVNSQFTATAFPKPNLVTLGGGYHFSQYLGVEAGYAIVGDSTINTMSGGATAATETVKSSALQLVAVGTYPFNEMFEVFGKLGLSYNKADYTAAPGAGFAFGPGAVTAASGSKTDLTYGVGAQFNVNKQFGIRAQYQDFGKVTVNSVSYGAKVISAGVVFNF